MIAALHVVGAYLLGSVPTGLLVGRLWGGVDIREFGSGKTGFTNALRTVGPLPAAIVVGGDVAKGALPVLLARIVFDDPWAAALGGLAAVIGHSRPLFAGFRGGRGVATTFGAFLAMTPLVALLVLVASVTVLGITRYVSLMSVTGTAVGLIAMVAMVAMGATPAEYLLFGLGVTAWIEFGHIGNLRRLLSGTEPKLGRGGDRRSDEGRPSVGSA